jgi:hypothetical protein
MKTVAVENIDPKTSGACFVFRRRLARRNNFRRGRQTQMMGPHLHSVKARFEVAGRQISVWIISVPCEQIRMTRCGKDVSAQSDFGCGPGKSLKPRARGQPAGQNQTKIEEKLKNDEGDEDSSRAVLKEPPDTEEKQDTEQRLISVQDRQGRTAIGGKNRKSRPEQAIP